MNFALALSFVVLSAASGEPPAAKPLHTTYTPQTSDVQSMMSAGSRPYYPTCAWKHANGDEMITVVESTGTLKKQWGCKVQNLGNKDYLVRVLTTRVPHGHKKNKIEVDQSYFYEVKAGQTILANSGQGEFNKNSLNRCLLCGAVEVEGDVDFKNLGATNSDLANTFQCRSKCYATLFENENFNGAQRTIAWDTKDLSNLKGISSVKVGRGCNLLAYSGFEKDGKPEEMCQLKASDDKDTAFNKDYLDTYCKSNSCSGNDCIKSVKLYLNTWCGKQPTPERPAASCLGCPAKKAPGDIVAVEKLAKLFKRLSANLEE